MPTVRQLLEEAVPGLRESGVDTPILDAEVLLAHALRVSRTALLAHPEREPPPKVTAQFSEWITRRIAREPLAYIIGEREFQGLTFEVGPCALIPRQETEVLVDIAVESLLGVTSPLVADIGLGTGCVAIAIAHTIPGALVYGTEFSKEALELAVRNSRKLGVAERVRFMEGDLLGPLSGIQVHIIVSNPPYIPTVELGCLQPEVARYEPREALDGGPDGLNVIRRLASESWEYLLPGGSLAVEVGAGQSRAVAELFREHGFSDVRFAEDLSGIERVVIGKAG